VVTTLALAGVTAGTANAAGGHRTGPPLPSAADPTVSGPVTAGQGLSLAATTMFDLSQVGYEQSEYFLSGTATAYQPVSPLTTDGKWTVAPAGSPAPYTTRIVVYRPVSRAHFNGTVVVEWLNVSGGQDAAPDWINAHNELIRDGYAWVGVSAQAVGLNAVKATDPVRYGTLSHPGDSYSYDMYSQAGTAIRNSAAAILGDLHLRTVLAAGESQSASRLTTYINAVQPLVNVFDGFLVHSRSASGAPLSQPPQATIPDPAVVLFRTDLRVPVLAVESETDLLLQGYLPARQHDSATFRLWEVAGTAHYDAYGLGAGYTDTGNGIGDAAAFTSMLNPPASPFPGATCDKPLNTGEFHYVLEAAVKALTRWVTAKAAPAKAPRLQVTSSPSPTFILDGNGNVLGGIRTPAVDVALATLSGLGQTGGGSQFCRLFGTTTPFNAAKLANLYPTHRSFVHKWSFATLSAAQAGFILCDDAHQLITAAHASTVGN
jgi:hypothetical protein